MDPIVSLRIGSSLVAGAAFCALAAWGGHAESMLLRTRTESDTGAPPEIRDVRAFPRLAVTTLWLARDLALFGAGAAGTWLGGPVGACALAAAAWAAEVTSGYAK